MQDQIPIQEEYTHGFDNSFDMNFLDEFDFAAKCEPPDIEMDPEQEELMQQMLENEGGEYQ